jgi:hypothetical protein
VYLLLNGAFGIGKTAVGQRLRELLPSAIIFDPEPIGLLLQRWPGHADTDFQDLPMWRLLVPRAAQLAANLADTVIMPMAFSNVAYLEEVRSALAESGTVRHFCLTAPLEVVQRRLAGRGEHQDDRRFAWVHQRARECCEAHRRPEFAIHVATERLDAAEVATVIRTQLAGLE